MKKICFVATVSITVRAFILPLIKYLKEKTDWDISVICDEDVSLTADLPEGVRYFPVPMERGISLGGISAMLQMVRIFKQEKFDLVQYSTPNASLYASIAAAIVRVPIRLYCQWGMAYVGFHGIKRKIFKLIEKLVCSLSTWVEPDSFGNLEFSHSEGLYPDEKGSVIWNGSASGVDLEKFDIQHKAEWRAGIREQYAIPEDAFIFGFIGRITGDKGINELFSAYRQIYQHFPNTYLMLVGNAEKSASADEELYHWAQNEPRVLFCGYTNVVEQYLSAMDVYVLPSYREGFGSAVIEAEAMGVPVIVSDIPGPTDAMKPDVTGLLVRKADVDSLYDAMVRLYNDTSLCKLYGDAGHEFASKNFEQKQLFERIAADRDRLLGRNGNEPA